MSDNKRIAKNTVYLYLRMFINILVQLYTSRVVLEVLGVEDFGIYNLVAGVVVLFAFLNNAMTNATQRFLNVEIANNTPEKIRRVFSMSLNIHVLIALVVILLSETIGLWFLNHKLSIPDNRINAANIIYHISVFNVVIKILRIPYNALIIAKERMSFYALLSVFDVFAKLGIVYLLLLFSDADHLILYCSFLIMVSAVMNIIYYVYCRREFKFYTSYFYFKDKNLFLELISFSGWSLFGQVAVVGSTQGVNMILNMFLGVVVNAAMGIANQVNGAVFQFISNLQLAFNPQIVQTYAQDDIDRHKRLILNGAKISFFLLLIIAIPFFLYSDFIIKLWLGDNVPMYTTRFAQLIILSSCFGALSGPFWISANAIGNIRNYQVSVSLIYLLNLPITYLLLKLNLSPVLVIASQAAINGINFLYRFKYIHSKVGFYNKEIRTFFIIIFGVSIVPLFALYLSWKGYLDNDSIMRMIMTTLVMELILMTFILIFGFRKNEKKELLYWVKQKTNKIFRK